MTSSPRPQQQEGVTMGEKTFRVVYSRYFVAFIDLLGTQAEALRSGVWCSRFIRGHADPHQGTISTLLSGLVPELSQAVASPPGFVASGDPWQIALDGRFALRAA